MELNDNPEKTASETAEETIVSDFSPADSSASDDFKPLEHPLLNPLLVDKVVEQLNPTFEQLKNIRLISKIWKEATLHHWRNLSAAVTLIPDPGLFTRTKYSNGVPVSLFWEEFHNPESPFQLASKPFSSYKFKGHTFDLQVCNKVDGPAKAFWNQVGPVIESLEFENCKFLPVSHNLATCPMVQLLSGSIPNIKKLAINQKEIQGPATIYLDLIDQDQNLPFLVTKPLVNLRTLTVYGNLHLGGLKLENLLRMAPNLEFITGIDLPDWKMGINTLMQPICDVRFKTNPEVSSAPLSNLKHLDLINSSTFLSEDYSWASVTELMDGNVTQLPLETLTLQLQENHSNLRFEGQDVFWHLDKFLTSFSGTLKELKVFRVPVRRPYLTFLSGSFGEMTALKELELLGTIAPNFGFLKSTPNLTRLRISFGCFEKRRQLLPWKRERDGNGKYRKFQGDMALNLPRQMVLSILCLEMEFLEIDYEFPEESLRMLGNWMPNLKILKTILNKRTVPAVCDVWRDLTELACLHGSKIGNCCIFRDEEKVEPSQVVSEKLQICNLKDLERFQLETYCGESELTDEAIFKGFLKMPGLKSVQICVGKGVSKEAVEALRGGVKFCDVVRNDEKVDVKLRHYTDIVESCGCDRCAFHNDEERDFWGSDDEDDDSESSGGSWDEVDRIFGRGQLDDSDENDSSSESDDGSATCETKNSSDSNKLDDGVDVN